MPPRPIAASLALGSGYRDPINRSRPAPIARLFAPCHNRE